MPADGGARERSWRVVQAAFDGSAPRRQRRPPWAWLAVLAALAPVAAVGVAAASAPKSDIGRWVRGVLGAGERDPKPVLGRVPGGGRLLVQAGPSAWVVASDGAKRRLGVYSATAWSPRGLFVVGWRGLELTALEPGGAVRWSLTAREPIAAARWAPVDGYRIAYVAGSVLRVVNGDGTNDHRYGAARPAVAPAWRPDGKHVLAYADARGRVSVVAVDSRTRLWRTGIADVRSLAWSPGGRRLLVVTGRRLVVFDRAGKRIASRAIPSTFVVDAAAWSPRGGGLALVRYSAPADRSELVLADATRRPGERVLFAGPGRFGALAWSPDGTRLLLPWRDADQWLFLRLDKRARLTAVANIADQFGAGRARPPFPRAVQWCC